MPSRAPLSSPATLVVVALASFLALSAAACTEGGTRPPGTPGGDGGGSDGGTPSSGLRIEPADHEVTVTGGATATIEYRAFFRDAAGAEREVTSEVGWTSLAPSLGTFSGSSFISVPDRGGRATIRASMGLVEATTSLTIRLDRQVVTGGAPDDAPSRFGGTADPARAPELVYPESGTMVPPNLQELEFHYRPNGSTVFELHVQTSALDLRIYFGCPESVGGGCIYTPDRDVWESIATAAAGQGPISYRLRGVNDAGQLGETEELQLTVAAEPITGGLYYWNAGAGAIERFEFGVRGARAERFIDSARAGASMCVGCHTLSRDGSRIAVGTDFPTTTFQVFDVASRNRIFSLGMAGGFFPQESNFASFSPDNSQIATSMLSGLRILDGASGAVVTENLGGGPTSMPDWSPDGEHIVAVRHDAPSVGGLPDVMGVTSGRIVRLDRSGACWGGGPTLGGGGGNKFNRAFAPHGEWVVFNRSASNTGSAGADPDSGMTSVPDGELWVIRADGTGTAMRLSRLSGYADTWPKWDPTVYRDRERDLFWLTWTSRRAFGLRLGQDARSQLWMAAFDPEEAAAGREAAYPAFRLPFQDIETGNHIGQWVTTVERQTCDTNVDCGGEFCVDGRCYQTPPLI